MTAPEPVQPAFRLRVGVVAVWAVAVLAAVAVGLFAAPVDRAAWLVIAMAGCVILSFAVQLGRGETTGFIARTSSGVLGAMVILAIGGGVIALVAAVTA